MSAYACRIRAGRLVVLALLAFVPLGAFAATLSVSPSSTTVPVGSTLTATVMVNSGGTVINSAEGTLSFPSNLFDVLSVDKNGSLFSVWIQAPAYDGDSSISFNGGLPSPGYQGSAGHLFTVTLRAKAVGSGTITLSNAAVRANDGYGTNVLTSTGAASVSVAAPVTPAPVATPTSPASPSTSSPSPASTVPGAVQITSPTDPSPDAWYASSTAAFAWSVPDGTDEVETLMTNDPTAVPSVRYQPAISEKTVTDLADGVWYFLLRAHTATGWNPVSSYRVQIDTTPPTLSGIRIVYQPQTNSLILEAAADTPSASSGALALRALATDTGSGIANFELLVDGSVIASIAPADLSGNSHIVPITLATGAHTALLRVLDAAGNYTDSEPLSFTVAARSLLPGFIGTYFGSASLPSILLVLAVFLSLVSVLMTALIWRRVHHHTPHNKRPLGADLLERVVRQRLITMSHELDKQCRELERMHARGAYTTEEADYVKQLWERVAQAERYLERKAREIEDLS